MKLYVKLRVMSLLGSWSWVICVVNCLKPKKKTEKRTNISMYVENKLKKCIRMILLNMICCIFWIYNLKSNYLAITEKLENKDKETGKNVNIHDLITWRWPLLTFWCLTFQNYFFYIYMCSWYESYFINFCV